MVLRIVIAGESQCEVFAEVCLVADYLMQHLPHFCYERIEKSVLQWETWLSKINQKNKWHHCSSPLIWKELLLKGSKPYYIGGGAEFLEYCYSYYQFDAFLTTEVFEGLSDNFSQFAKKIKLEIVKDKELKSETVTAPYQRHFVVTISGAGNPIAMHLISELLSLAVGDKIVTRIYMADEKHCSEEFLEYIERECSYILNDQPGRVVKYVNKLGMALTHSDLFIILDHEPFDVNMPIGTWLYKNKEIMQDMALHINASASRKMFVIIPNLGPACYNATILTNAVNINKKNIVVATSDLGLEITTFAAEIAEIPVRNMFCPPVWGFVGINHLVDIRTTVHKYCTFQPYKRYTRVKNSSLIVGSLTPELRTMEYLMYNDETLWKRVADNKVKNPKDYIGMAKVLAVINLAKLWLFDRDPNNIVNLGVRCNGSFGLTFKGTFSQPSRFVDGFWVPAADYIMPKDPYMSLKYLENMAEYVMQLQETQLPRVIPFCPCICKRKTYDKIKKGIW